MRDYVNIGATPADELCEQLGPAYDPMKARKECLAFKHQLERVFPKASFGVKSFPHDFGTYMEVVAFFEDEDAASVEAAFEAERATPERWDEEALRELGD